MGSQQVKTSIETAPHKEPAPITTEIPDRTSKSLDAPPFDVRRTSKSKVPTGLGAEPLNIVILGASFGGLSCAHHFLDYTIEQLRKTTTAPNYRLVIVSPSTHIYWVSITMGSALSP